MKKVILLLIMTISLSKTKAQSTYNSNDYAKNPVWIDMMADEHANYFETIK